MYVLLVLKRKFVYFIGKSMQKTCCCTGHRPKGFSF